MPKNKTKANHTAIGKKYGFIISTKRIFYFIINDDKKFDYQIK